MNLNEINLSLICSTSCLTFAEAGLIFLVRFTTSPSAEIMATISPLLSKVSALICTVERKRKKEKDCRDLDVIVIDSQFYPLKTFFKVWLNA